MRGQGLRPKVSIEAARFSSRPRGITDDEVPRPRPLEADRRDLRRHRALGRPQDAVPHGHPVDPEGRGARREEEAPPTAPPPGAPGTGTPPRRLRVRRRARTDLHGPRRRGALSNAKITAFAGRPMRLRPFVDFDTASHPESGEAMVLAIAKGTYRPGRAGAPSFLEFSGSLEGEIENGVMEFQENRSTIARGGCGRRRSSSPRTRTARSFRRSRRRISPSSFPPASSSSRAGSASSSTRARASPSRT